MKNIISKTTLYELMKLFKTNITNNHNHDNRYYTEEEVLSLLNKQKEEIQSLRNEITNKQIKIDTLLYYSGFTEAIDNHLTQELNGSIYDYTILCFVIGYLGYAAEDAVTIPTSRFSYESASVNLIIGDTVAANIKFKTGTTVDISNIHNNRKIHIYGIKI